MADHSKEFDLPEIDRLLREHRVMREVLASLDFATRVGGMGGLTPFDVGFIWAQNQDALLAGDTTWGAQAGHFGSKEDDRG